MLREKEREKMNAVGTLVEFDWKLGVAVVSSHCQNLKIPFVRVTMKVEDGNHQVQSHTFEMNIAEFKVKTPSIQFSFMFLILFSCFLFLFTTV